MPTYNFRNKDGDVHTEFLRMSELDPFLADHPELELVPSAPAIISGVNLKPDNGFRDLLKRMKKTNPGSKINDFGGSSEI